MLLLTSWQRSRLWVIFSNGNSLSLRKEETQTLKQLQKQHFFFQKVTEMQQAERRAEMENYCVD